MLKKTPTMQIKVFEMPPVKLFDFHRGAKVPSFVCITNNVIAQPIWNQLNIFQLPLTIKKQFHDDLRRWKNKLLA